MMRALEAGDPFAAIGEIGVVPVITIDDVRHALPSRTRCSQAVYRSPRSRFARARQPRS